MVAERLVVERGKEEDLAQAALFATAGAGRAGRAGVCSVKGGQWPPFWVRLNVETLGEHGHSGVKRP